MKSLKLTVTGTSITSSPAINPAIKTEIVPALLKDEAGEVYKDDLCCQFTTSTSIVDSTIHISLIATNLVKHTRKGEKGYWLGVGIPENSIHSDTKVYVGWGEPNMAVLTSEQQTFEKQEVDGKQCVVFYFDAEKSRKFGQVAYIVLETNSIRIDHRIDFTQVSIKESQVVEPIVWSAINVDDVKNKYLFGIDLSDAQGNPLPEELFVHYINSAIDWLQNTLDITIRDTEFVEEVDYIRNDYQNWGYLNTMHAPVKKVESLTLMYGDKPSVNIPLDWLKPDKLTGQITLFPSAGSANSLIIGQTGLLFGFQSQWDWAPKMWQLKYTAGIDENDPSMPLELLKEAIYKRASMGILNVWGDLIIGAGIASQSVSIDGLSQSIGTTQSPMFGGASARVENYAKDLKENILPALIKKFSGTQMVVI